MIDLPRINTNNTVYTSTPSQVNQVQAIPDNSKHEKNERERRKQQNRRRLKGKSKAVIDRRLAQDRRKPSFEAQA
jgi:hypothetical protein